MFRSLRDPSAALTWWDEQSLPLLQCTFVTLVHLVGEEHFAVIGWWSPSLVQGQVGRGGLDEEKDLFSLQTQTQSRVLALSSYERWSFIYSWGPHHFRIEENQCCRNWLSHNSSCCKANSDSTHWSSHECDRPLGRGTRQRRRRTQCGSLCSCLWHRWDSILWLLASRAGRHQASSFLPKTTAARSVDSPLYCSSCPRKTDTEISSRSFPDWRLESNLTLETSFQTPASVTESAPRVRELQVDDV